MMHNTYVSTFRKAIRFLIAFGLNNLILHWFNVGMCPRKQRNRAS